LRFIKKILIYNILTYCIITMTCEHLPQEKFPYVGGDGICRKEEGFEISDAETLPISDILRFMTHEKFVLSGLIILGIVKVLLVLKFLQML
jgi:hypothetical protein